LEGPGVEEPPEHATVLATPRESSVARRKVGGRTMGNS
jgi:hypothetical protein